MRFFRESAFLAYLQVNIFRALSIKVQEVTKPYLTYRLAILELGASVRAAYDLLMPTMLDPAKPISTNIM